MAKGAYIGIQQEEQQLTSTVLTPNNINNYCKISNSSSYYFTHNSDGTFVSNNSGIEDSSKATTRLDFSTLLEKWDAATPFTLSYTWTISSEENYDIFTMYNYNNDSEIYIQTSGNKNGNGSIIIYPGSRIALEYEKDRTTLSGSDKATIKFTLKNEIPSTSGSRARAIIAMYIGVNGVARKIKKAYIGINGVARCFWAIPKIEKVNTSIQSLTPRHDFMSGSLGNYAIYAGGGVLPENSDNYPIYYSTNIVEYYDNSLSKKIASPLPFSVGDGKMQDGAGVANEKFFFVGGGFNYVAEAEGAEELWVYSTSEMIKYNTSMTLSSASSLTRARKHPCTGTANNTYAIIAGGVEETRAEYFNNSGTRSSATALPEVKFGQYGGSLGEYCIFPGGSKNSSIYSASTTNVVAYNGSMTQINIPQLTVPRREMGVGAAGDYLICYCGIIERSNPTKTTECYNKSLTKVAIASANIAKSNVNSASPNKQFACFFHGKVKGDNKQLNEVEVYDSSLTKYFLSNTNSGRMASKTSHNGKNCATMAGNYIILAGGCVTGEGGLSALLSSTAEAYKYNP